MNRRYGFHPGVYELGENEKFYSDMEAKGWRLVKRGLYLSRFERAEPSRARYRVEVYTPPFLEQSVLPEAQIAVFEDCGWEYVTNNGHLHIFRAPEGSAAPEFYDDPVQQAATLRKARRDLCVSLGISAVILGLAVWWFLRAAEAGAWARLLKRAVQCPPIYAFYVFWLLFVIYRDVWSCWKINCTYRRLKKGLPLDHAPKGRGVLRKIFSQGMLGLAVLSLLLTAAQLITTDSRDLPAEPDGPYIMLRDAGYDGVPGKLFYADPGVTFTRSFLADYWETLEVINIPAQNDRQVWMRQHVYRLRLPGLADSLAWALMEDSVFVRDADAFDAIEVPGLDGAWTTGALELAVVKGEKVAYVEFLASGVNGEFDLLPICKALAAKWAEP